MPDRGFQLVAAAVTALVEGADPGPPRLAGDLELLLGGHAGRLALSYPAGDPAWSVEYAREALDDACAAIDRLRGGHAGTAGARIEHLRPAPAHGTDASAARDGGGGAPRRLGLDEDSMEALEDRVLAVLEPKGAVARAHDDPDPRRRVMRRILQRLDGMGKWGGYHTAFDHLARGFAGHERQLAFEVGGAGGAGLLAEKPSVGQRHVFLNPRKAGEIRRLIEDGELPPGLQRSLTWSRPSSRR